MSDPKYNYGDFLEDEGGHLGLITYVPDEETPNQYYWITWWCYLTDNKMKGAPTFLFEKELDDGFRDGLFEYIGQHDKLFSMYLLLRENNEH